MRIDISCDEAYLLKYAILSVASVESSDRHRRTYVGLLDKIKEAEQCAYCDDDLNKLLDQYDSAPQHEPSRFPLVNEDDPNKPGVGDAF